MLRAESNLGAFCLLSASRTAAVRGGEAEFKLASGSIRALAGKING